MIKRVFLIIIVLPILLSSYSNSYDYPLQLTIEAGVSIPLYPKFYFNSIYDEIANLLDNPEVLEWDKNLPIILSNQEIDLNYFYLENEIYYTGATTMEDYSGEIEDEYREFQLCSNYSRFQDNLSLRIKLIDTGFFEWSGIAGFSVYHLNFKVNTVFFPYDVGVIDTSLFGYGYIMGSGVRIKTDIFNCDVSFQYRKPEFGTNEYIDVYQLCLPASIRIGEEKVGFSSKVNLEYLHGRVSQPTEIDEEGDVLGCFFTGGVYLYL